MKLTGMGNKKFFIVMYFNNIKCYYNMELHK